MARHFSWKAKVVISIGFTLLLYRHAGWAQTTASQKWGTLVTLSCQNLRLEEVLQKLSLKSGVFFIYSTSVVALDRPVSFTVREKPLGELLQLIGNPLNLTFRYEGKYIIIKHASPLPVATKPKLVTQPIRRGDGAELSLAHASLEPATLTFYNTRTAFFFEPSPLRAPVVPLVERKVPGLDSMTLLTITRPQDLIRKRWFASAGIFVNDFTYGGVELRGGLKSLYGVVNTGYVKDGLYRIGYGLGTSVPLTDRLSFNVIYNYARMQTSQDFSVSRYDKDLLIFKDAYKVSFKHNNLRVMAQYRILPRLELHLGTSLNILHTTYAAPAPLARTRVRAVFIENGNRGLIEKGQNAVFSHNISNESPIVIAAPALGPAYEITRIWAGWEAGIFYRINF